MVKEAEILENLAALQAVDSSIQAVELQQEEIRAKIAALEEGVKAARAEFAAKQESLNSHMKKMAAIDLDVKTREAEIKKKEEQTGAVKTNEAFKALQGEIDTLKESIKKLEDAKLEVMELEEKERKWVKEQDVVLKKSEADIRAEIEKHNAEIKELGGKIDGIMKEREEKKAAVEKTWYERYERIRKNKGGLAIATLNYDAKGNGTCGGCNFGIRPQAVIEVRKKQKIYTCENCARLWYIK